MRGPLARLIAPGLILLMIGVLVLRQPAAPSRIERQIYTMGTLVSLTVIAGKDREAAERGLSLASQTLQQFHRDWSVAGQGKLAQVNASLASGNSAQPDSSLMPLIQQAKNIALRSESLFDPGLGAWVQLWGWDDIEHMRQAPPDAEALAAALARPHRLAEADLSTTQLRASGPGLLLDFGAIAKGAAVDAALATLKAAGVEQAMVNAGGDLKVSGQAEQRPWRVAIRHPRPQDNSRLLATIALHDGEAIFTSGDYERYFEHQGRRYHHLLDIRTGMPATASQSATVIHANGAMADAAATALFVGGPDAFARLTKSLALELAMIVDAQGEAWCTPALCQRLEWTGNIVVHPLGQP